MLLFKTYTLLVFGILYWVFLDFGRLSLKSQIMGNAVLAFSQNSVKNSSERPRAVLDTLFGCPVLGELYTHSCLLPGEKDY